MNQITNPIGTLNEKTLHADLKWLLSESHDQLEKQVDNYLIDIVRDDLLIEIQTSNFAIIRKKLENLVQNNKVCFNSQNYFILKAILFFGISTDFIVTSTISPTLTIS